MQNGPGAAWLVGNSQLITSLLAAYCSPEDQRRASEDWSGRRVTRGALHVEPGHRFEFLACNMQLLGEPAFSNNAVSASSALLEFAGLIEPAPRVIVLMLRGNEFAMESLVDDRPHWDFSYPGMPATPGRQLLRARDVAAHFARVMEPTLAMCLLYRHTYPQAQIYHVAAPPPIESQQHILEQPEVFGELLAEQGLRPFELRLKIYQALYQPLAERLAGFGVQTLFAPAQSLTPAGGLRSEFASGCLHGNHAYGRALMADLLARGIHASV